MTHTTVFHQHSSGNFYHDYESRSSTCNETSSGLEHSLQKNLTLPSHDYMPVTSVLNKIVLIVLIVSNVVKKATKQWAVWKNQYVRETGAGSCQGTNCDQFTPVHCLHSSMRSLWMGSYPVWTLKCPCSISAEHGGDARPPQRWMLHPISWWHALLRKAIWWTYRFSTKFSRLSSAMG